MENDLNFTKLKNSTILITGATGMIGSEIIKYLYMLNKKYDYNIKIIALYRNRIKLLKKLDYIIGDNNFIEFEVDLARNSNLHLDVNIDYIIHTASMTSSSDFVNYPIETIETSIFGTNTILDFGVKKNIKSMIYLSSLEVYGVVDKNPITEKDYGYIDFTLPRSSYSEGKRMTECLCCSYAHEKKLPITIARLCQTFGEGVDIEDNRVYAQFARCVIENKDIILNTNGETTRNYLYTLDAVTAILTILLNGKVGDAYNVANPNIFISIKDMAELVCNQFGESRINVIYNMNDQIDKFGYNPMIKINLNVDKLLALGWNPTLGINDMFKKLIKNMKANQCNN